MNFVSLMSPVNPMSPFYWGSKPKATFAKRIDEVQKQMEEYKKNYSTKTKASNVFIQKDENISAIYDHDYQSIMDLNNEEQSNKNILVDGGNYYLDNAFNKENIDKVFKLKKKVHRNGDSYVVLKCADGFDFPIYSLSPTLCEYLGVEYEDGLTVFPIETKLKRYYSPIVEHTEFNPNDLSTYPTQEGVINFMIIKLSGFQSLRKHHLVTPNNKEVDPQKFLKKLQIKFKCDLDGEENNTIRESQKIKWELLMVEEEDIARQGCVCDKDGDMYLKIDLRGLNITPSMVSGLSASDVFTVSWVELPDKKEERAFSNVFGENNDDVDYPSYYDGDDGYIEEPIEPKNGMIRVKIDRREKCYEVYYNGRWNRITEDEFRRLKNNGTLSSIDPSVGFNFRG